MNDGPFRNVELDRRSKRFLVALGNPAVDEPTCAAHAMVAICHGLIEEAGPVLAELAALRSCPPLDLDLMSTLNHLVDRHPKSEFGDALKRLLAAQIDLGDSVATAISSAQATSIENRVEQYFRRMNSAYLEAYNKGELTVAEYNAHKERSDRARCLIDLPRLCEAVKSQDKGAFKTEVSKKRGVDEGPAI